MTGPAPILIAGGGIAGLALALALAHRGIWSTVLERQHTPTAAGAGIQLGPNGVRALRTLGVADALKAAGVENTGVKLDETLGKRYVAFKDPDRIAWEFYTA